MILGITFQGILFRVVYTVHTPVQIMHTMSPNKHGAHIELANQLALQYATSQYTYFNAQRRGGRNIVTELQCLLEHTACTIINIIQTTFYANFLPSQEICQARYKQLQYKELKIRDKDIFQLFNNKVGRPLAAQCQVIKFNEFRPNYLKKYHIHLGQDEKKPRDQGLVFWFQGTHPRYDRKDKADHRTLQMLCTPRQLEIIHS